MPSSNLLPKLIAALFLVAALSLGLTTYTLPNHGTPSYAALRALVTTSLGESLPAVPPADRNLDIQPATPFGASPADLATTEERASTMPAAEAVEWVRAAADQDSAALRAWLGRLVLVTAITDGDTVRTVLRRLTFHGRCPLLSALHLTSVGQARGSLRLTGITGSCPPGLPDARAGARPAR
jgi:hypothetical protein